MVEIKNTVLEIFAGERITNPKRLIGIIIFALIVGGIIAFLMADK